MEPTATVFVRHGRKCPHTGDPKYPKCRCRKSLVLYDGVKRDENGKLINKIKSAKTRTWSVAQKAANDWLDSLNPEKVELNQLRAAKERKQIHIEDAVAFYYADLKWMAPGTLSNLRTLFGHVDPITKQVRLPGNLFAWLDKQSPRPVYIADISVEHLTTWRSTWKYSDLTAKDRWSKVRSFFNFCERHEYVEHSPARNLKAKRVKKGNRTTAFTDEQYEKILEAVRAYHPENVPAATRKHWQQRLMTFVELMRWTGMDLVDAIQFTPSLVSDDVLCYHRQKNGNLATIAIPERLVVLLRDIPLERDSVGASQPFRQKNVSIGSDKRTWGRRLGKLFLLAGITEVKTEHRVRKPHPKMLRDTFAVWHIEHGASLRTVSKALGHSSTNMTEKHYLPWVNKLKNQHTDDMRNSLAQMPKPKDVKNVVAITSRK